MVELHAPNGALSRGQVLPSTGEWTAVAGGPWLHFDES
jgi:hypothetical protein